MCHNCKLWVTAAVAERAKLAHFTHSINIHKWFKCFSNTFDSNCYEQLNWFPEDRNALHFQASLARNRDTNVSNVARFDVIFLLTSVVSMKLSIRRRCVSSMECKMMGIFNWTLDSIQYIPISFKTPHCLIETLYSLQIKLVESNRLNNPKKKL